MANDPDFLAKSDLLLVTLKAWQVSDAAKGLAATLPETTLTLLIHNGMGMIEELYGVRQPLPMGTIAHTTRRDGSVIIHVAQGTTRIGPTREQDDDFSCLAEVLQEVLPDITWHDTIRAELWCKSVVNYVTNPLIALQDRLNGESRHHLGKVTLICEEVTAVIEREGHHTSVDGSRYYVEQVTDSTAGNTSSMLQDVHALRHTEIDYVTGYLLKRARAHGIAVPKNIHLLEMVKRKGGEHERLSTGMSRP